MSKAVLVMDMPESCEWCPLGRLFGTAGAVECNVANKINRNCESVPDWCPLRPMPEKDKRIDTCINKQYVRGWNACIYAIGGGNGAEAK